MATNSPSTMISPLMAPDLMEKQFRLQQQSEFLQRALQQASQPNEGRMVSGHWIPPDAGRAVANAFGTYAGYRGMEDMPKQMAELLRARQAHQQGVLQAAYSGGQPGQPGTPDNSGRQGLSPQELLQASLMGVDKYALERMKQNAPTPEQKNLGFMTPAARNATIGGQYLQKAVGPDGAQLGVDQSGRMVAAPIQGLQDIRASGAGAIADAQAKAKSANSLTTVPMGEQGTQLMTEAEAIRQANAGGGTPVPGGVTGSFGRTPNPARGEARTKFNNDWIDNSYRPAITAGQAAQSLKGEIQALRGIDFPTGALGAARGVAANFLNTLGVKDAEKYATSSQAFQGIAMQRIQRDMALQKGPQTDADAVRAQQTWTALSNTPQANKYLLDLAEANADLATMKADYFTRARNIMMQSGQVPDFAQIEERWQRQQPSVWDNPILSPYGGNINGD